MASSINADNGVVSGSSGLKSTADTSGVLALQTNGTTALTINTDLSATFAGAVTASSFSGTTTTATNLAGGSNGTIPYQSASGTTQMLAVGTSGQVLTSSGAGAPTWTTPSGGAMVLISTLTASNSASLEWTGLTTYNRYLLIFENIYCTSAGRIEIQVGTGSTTYVTTGYYFASISNKTTSPGTTSGTAVSNGATICVSLGNNPISPSGLSGFCYVLNMTNGNNTMFNFHTSSQTAENPFYGNVTGNGALDNNTTTKTAIRIINVDGGLNLSVGKVSLYGITS